jgi:2-dehydropantoate 2-reductase
MENKEMKITIVGAGAIGGISGAYLTKAGRDVTMVEPYREHLERIRKGVRIDGVRGEMTVPLNAVSPDELKGPLGVVLLAVKSTKTLEALDNIKPLLDPDTVIVSFQNGINEDTIASAVGPERVIGCSIGWGATFVGPGHLSQTSEGAFIIGELNGEMSERLDYIKSILDDIAETKTTAKIYGHLWSKLSINCLIAGCAVLGLTVGEALEPERNKRLFVRLIREVIAAAEANGVRMELIEGAVDPYVFRRDDEEGMALCFQILDFMSAIHGRIKPGPLQDMERGVEPEVDYVTGYCVKKAREKNVTTPINAKVYELLKKMEKGKVKPTPKNLAELEGAE